MSMMGSGRCWSHCCPNAYLSGLDVLVLMTGSRSAPSSFVLVTGVPWRVLPREVGCSDVTAWRRLRRWQAAGVWDRLHRELLRRLNALGRLDWSAGVVDGSHLRVLRVVR
jgi:transposase